MKSWRDPTNEDKRPLRMSEVIPDNPPQRNSFLPSIFSVTAILLALSLLAGIFYLLYAHQLRITELTTHLNYNGQKVNASSGRSISRLEQVSTTLTSLEKRVEIINSKQVALETSFSHLDNQLKTLSDPNPKDTGQEIKREIELIRNDIKQIRSEIQSVKAVRAAPAR